MSRSVRARPAPFPPDPIDEVPSPTALRAVIREYVCRTEVLRHLLRVAVHRERLGMKVAEARRAVRRRTCPSLQSPRVAPSLGDSRFTWNLALFSKRDGSQRIDQMLPAVLRIADQALLHRIDHPIERFQGNLTDQHGKIIRYFVDIH